MPPVAAPANTHVIFGSLDHITLMKAKDIFGLIVRVFGLAAFGWGFWYLYSALFMWMHSESMGTFVSRDYLAAGAMCVVVGLVFAAQSRLGGRLYLPRFAKNRRMKTVRKKMTMWPNNALANSHCPSGLTAI